MLREHQQAGTTATGRKERGIRAARQGILVIKRKGLSGSDCRATILGNSVPQVQSSPGGGHFARTSIR
jgi:hypothetical protein